MNKETGLIYSLSVRTDRPVVGCELSPHPFLALKGGNIDNATRGKIMEANPHYFALRWTVGPRKAVCANSSCPRGTSMDPMQWSRFARGGPGLCCAICDRMKTARTESSFCSTRFVVCLFARHLAAALNLLGSLTLQICTTLRMAKSEQAPLLPKM